jgi:hypothetical protein
MLGVFFSHVFHSKYFDNFEECGFKWTNGTFPIRGESTLGWTKNDNYKIDFGRFLVYFLT